MIVASYCLAVDALQRSSHPVKETLPMLRKIRENTPQMQEIWEFSSLGTSGLKKNIKAMLIYEEEIKDALQKGQITMDENFPARSPKGTPMSLIHDSLTGSKYE